MAKKRKVNPKVEPEPVAEVMSSSSEEESEEEEEEESEEEGSGEEESEEESSEEEQDGDEHESKSDETRRETVKTLLEPFGKDQLIEILKQAATKNSVVLEKISSIADRDPSHRKIFVHGLGWDATNEILLSVFKTYGPIEDCNVVTDKATGRSKGYAFVIFKTRDGATKALKQPQKKIGNRMTASQLASFGPIPNNPVPDATGRKIYVSGIDLTIDIEKVRVFLSKFGELEDVPPLGLDKVTGKHRGFAVFIYKSPESAKKALEEPYKNFEGCQLHCKRALDGLKANNNPDKVNSAVSLGAGVLQPNNLALASTSLMGYPYNQGIGAFNTGLVGNAAGLGLGITPGLGALNPLASSINPTGLSPSVNPSGLLGTSSYGVGLGGYGAQAGINSLSSSVIGGYGSQSGLQGLGAYQSPQLGQSSTTKSPATGGTLGGLPSYYGR